MPFISIIKYWKEVVAIAAIAAIIAMPIYIKSLLKDKHELLIESGQLKEQIKQVINKNESLYEAVKQKEKEINKYILLNNKIQKNKEEISNTIQQNIEKINNEKIKTNEKNTIDSPIIIINAGMPKFSEYSSGKHMPDKQ